MKVDVAVIGAGSAGLSALRRVRKSTDNFVLINHGPYGTTCARVGCMPSKALIHIATNYHRRRTFSLEGIRGSEKLSCDIPAALRRVRELRDRFADGMVEDTKELAGERLISGKARLLDRRRIQVGDQTIEAGRIVIATGSRPFVPPAWDGFRERILTSDTVFEQEVLPPRMAVIGLGPIGLELGQALSRLGVEVTAFSRGRLMGGLSDPAVNERIVRAVEEEFPVHLGEAAEVEAVGDGLRVRSGAQAVVVDKILAGMGVRPNIEDLGLERIGVELDDRGVPTFDPQSMQVDGVPVYIGGDVNGCRPILHEAVDEGFIAGTNSAAGAGDRYRRRTPLRVVFSDPQIAVVGWPYRQLNPDEVVVGQVDYEDQGRARMEGRNQGLLRVYADSGTARILGAELVAPDGEHLGHLLASMIHHEATLFDALQMPFYHPTVEEGLRTALRDAAKKVGGERRAAELSLCDSCPEVPLC